LSNLRKSTRRDDTIGYRECREIGSDWLHFAEKKQLKLRHTMLVFLIKLLGVLPSDAILLICKQKTNCKFKLSLLQMQQMTSINFDGIAENNISYYITPHN